MTSPTYEGFSADIPEIAKLCKKHNAKLLIDGAHGALYPFDPENFAETGLNVDGVDIVV